ncbi:MULTISPECIES: YesL family protein [Niallia]|uniref:YesL family protein n=1 Tax=Niallia circulans TaxID=1397 RepID=A0A941GC22_NIACI|nr:MULTISPECIES: YesL family protein [Niallia]MCB5236072.1 YesL family protein [Niallia circulans]MED3794331.1 YesL family protein [Niallia alba]
MVHILSNGVYKFCEWVTRLAYVNILWLCFTVLGLGLFGWMPASMAMFAVTKKWVNGETDIRIFPVFWNSYKQDWWKGNILGIIIAITFFLFYLDFRIIGTFEGNTTLLLFVMLGLFLSVSTTFFYLLPVFTYYDLRLLEYIKYAFIIGFLRPFHTVGIFIAVLGVTLIASLHITLLLFFSISSLAFVITWIANKAFVSIDHRLRKVNQQRLV